MMIRALVFLAAVLAVGSARAGGDAELSSGMSPCADGALTTVQAKEATVESSGLDRISTRTSAMFDANGERPLGLRMLPAADDGPAGTALLFHALATTSGDPACEIMAFASGLLVQPKASTTPEDDAARMQVALLSGVDAATARDAMPSWVLQEGDAEMIDGLASALAGDQSGLIAYQIDGATSRSTVGGVALADPATGEILIYTTRLVRVRAHTR